MKKYSKTGCFYGTLIAHNRETENLVLESAFRIGEKTVKKRLSGMVFGETSSSLQNLC